MKLTSEQDNLWDDKEKAQEVFKKKRKLESLLNSFNNLKTEYNDLVHFYELFKSENDENLRQELFSLPNNTIKLSQELKINTLLSNEADSNDCYIEINAGAGGTESQDWAQMLLRMYLRWIEAKNFKKSIMNLNNGDEAGIKSATVKVEGENVFGLLK